MGANNVWAMFIIVVAMVVLYYFFLIKPQQKRLKEHKNMLEGLKPGNRIMTAGGFYGKILSVKEDEVIISLEPDSIKAKINISSIVSVLDK